MTENEIINYLKENKNKGIAFNFMPKDVRDWCCNRPNYFNDFLLYKNGAWRDEYCFVNPSTDVQEMVLEEIIILALPENFELKQESKGEWVEFEIDEGGDFGYLAESERDERYKSSYYSWYSWQKFLDDSRLNGRGFTAFGGWQYKENLKMWFLTPQVLKDNDLCCIKPLFPIKIRFWKEYK